MFGMQLAQGKCCAEKVTTTCFATMEAACPAGADTLGTVCTPSLQYQRIVQHVEVVGVPNPAVKVRGVRRGAASVWGL